MAQEWHSPIQCPCQDSHWPDVICSLPLPFLPFPAPGRGLRFRGRRVKIKAEFRTIFWKQQSDKKRSSNSSNTNNKSYTTKKTVYMEIKSSTSQPPVISPEKTPLLTALASDEMVSNNIRVSHVLFPATVLAKTRTCSLNMLTKKLLTSSTGEKTGTTSNALKDGCHLLSSNQSFPCSYQPSSREDEVDRHRQVLRSV